MDNLIKYMEGTLGLRIQEKPLDKSELGNLPFYINENYRFSAVTLWGKDLILARVAHRTPITVRQLEKQIQLMHQTFRKTIAIVAEEVTSITRSRLIEKRINFIVPNKQLFLPALMTNLRESFTNPKVAKTKLLPSAQAVLLHMILNRNSSFKSGSFKELADMFHYSQAAITKVVENLAYHKLVDVKGTKGKHLLLHERIPETWNRALPIFVNPILTSVYVDTLPETSFLCWANMSALSLYGDISEGNQKYVALDKKAYADLKSQNILRNPNGHEGRYCIEIWKYSPQILAAEMPQMRTVDPLSLYLSMRTYSDERIETALNGLIRKYVW